MRHRSAAAAISGVLGVLVLLLGVAGSPAASQAASIPLAGTAQLEGFITDRFSGFMDLGTTSGTGVSVGNGVTGSMVNPELRITGAGVSYSYSTTFSNIDNFFSGSFLGGVGFGKIVSMSIDVHMNATAFEQPGGPGRTIVVDASAITPDSSEVLRGVFVSDSDGALFTFEIVLSGFSQGGVNLEPASADPVTGLRFVGFFFGRADSSGFAASVPDAAAVAPLRVTGTATGVGRGSSRAGVAMLGTFALDRKVDLSTVTTVTIVSLLDDGVTDMLGLPLLLRRDPRNTARTAYFRPGIDIPARVTLHDRGRGEFTFRIEVSQGSLEPSSQCPHPTLATVFVFQDGVNPPVTVSARQPWLCLGGNQSLRTP